jgi:OmcA/MtrC family decaheme c-type cytochrome
MYGCSDNDGGGGPSGVTNPNTTTVVGSASVVDPTNIQADVLSVAINGPPVVTFRLLDEKGAPLDPTTTGVTARFTIAQIGADGNYKNYIKASTAGQPGFDSGGTFAALGNGTYSYTFKTDITDATKTLGNLAYVATRTHTLGAQIERTVNGFQQAANPYFSFLPSGGTVVVTREIAAISNCNNCHGSLRLHGGGRRELALCLLCHYPGIIDPETGNSVDMKSLVHKIHYGAKLPSNVGGGDFTIYGFSNSINSYKTVNYPDFSNDSTINGTPADCVKCHQLGKNLVGQTFGKDAAKYRENATMDKCVTCHDNVNFAAAGTPITVKNGLVPVTITNVRDHSGGVVDDPTRTDASKCVGCHPAGVLGVDEYDSIVGNTVPITAAHTVLEKSVTKFTGVNLKIVNVTSAIAGQMPAVTFTVKNNAGANIPLDATASFNLRVAYVPSGSLDYSNDLLPSTSARSAQPFSPASISTTNSTDNGDGTRTYTFTTALPAGLNGTGVVTLDGRVSNISYTTPHKGTVTTGRMSAVPDQWYFNTTTGAQITSSALKRRTVVEDARCLKCHDLIRGHGGSRISVADCVTCHNPYAVDTSLTNGKNNAFDFKYLIHKIHRGEDLTQPYWGFEEVRFPGIKGNCLACHATDTYLLPLKSGVVGTYLTLTRPATGNTVNNNATDVTNQMGAYESVCMSCHDNPTFQAEHLGPMGGNEICTNCHGAGAIKAVQTVHPIMK